MSIERAETSFNNLTTKTPRVTSLCKAKSPQQSQSDLNASGIKVQEHVLPLISPSTMHTHHKRPDANDMLGNNINLSV